MELPSDIPKTTINMQHVHIVKEKPQFYGTAFKTQDEWIKQLLWKIPYYEDYFFFYTEVFIFIFIGF